VVSDDGRLETVDWLGGSTYEIHREAAGFPTKVLIDGVDGIRLAWAPDGALSTWTDRTTEVRILRDQKRWINGVQIRSIDHPAEWTEEEWDALGRPVRVRDSSGFDYRISYNAGGQVEAAGRLTENGQLLGSKIQYDNAGRIVRMASSWGADRREYDADGRLRRIEVDQQDARAEVAFDEKGRPEQVTDLSKGVTRWTFNRAARSTLHPRQIHLPSGQLVRYEWATQGGATNEQILVGETSISVGTDADGRLTGLSWGVPRRPDPRSWWNRRWGK
jgi:YD repeat-containing protein